MEDGPPTFINFDKTGSKCRRQILQNRSRKCEHYTKVPDFRSAQMHSVATFLVADFLFELMLALLEFLIF